VKVLADLNVSIAVVARLRRSGIEVERVGEVMGSRSTDIEIVEAARERGSILLSHDQDFGAILAQSGASTPSLLNLRTTSIDADFLARCIRRALQEAASDLAAGAVVTVEDGGIRVRRLPVLND
jgi:predicted nuclease of predicted toxin-antitoxin system